MTDLRIARTLARLKGRALDALLVSSRQNISYLTRFNSRDSYLLISGKENIYFTDFRYLQQTRDALGKRFKIILTQAAPEKVLFRHCLRLGIKNLGFEENSFSHSFYSRFKQALGKSINFTPLAGFIEEMRMVKDKGEIAMIRQACRIAASALKFIPDYITCGIKELEIAAELERFIRYAGASSSAFEIIVASGKNSAYPHHATSGRKLREDENILIDIGVDYQGYKSDLTRVFFLGKINPLAIKVYDIIRKAQDKAIALIKPGVPINKIDRRSRDYISRCGYAANFRHGLGHGIGLEIHEEPNISAKQKAQLKPGMVFTVEPAIYLPGKFGIRLEDMVLVTNKGCEVLSGALHK